MGYSNDSVVKFEELSGGVRVLWDTSDPEGTAVVFESNRPDLEELAE